MRRLRRRYGHGRAYHGPGISWQGTDAIERRYYRARNALADVVLTIRHGERRQEALQEGNAFLTWLLSMSTKGAGVSGKRYLHRVTEDIRRMVHKAEAVR